MSKWPSTMISPDKHALAPNLMTDNRWRSSSEWARMTILVVGSRPRIRCPTSTNSPSANYVSMRTPFGRTSLVFSTASDVGINSYYLPTIKYCFGGLFFEKARTIISNVGRCNTKKL